LLKRHLRAITSAGAVMLIITGILMMTGTMTRISIELQGFGPGLI
jgi:hypothetical protein